MKILAIFKVLDRSDLESIQALLVEEERYVWWSYLEGVLREHYESDMPYAAISILELESVEAAREFFKDLPLLKAGLI
ncbi:MAG: superoxide dismutase [Leptolyngbya sp. SIO1D8]|nr:superoxide dismutase [Leptolyngbya sp. SIO1D8]